ncbi:formyltetrahydrofolate deformylase [Promicromonospora thailandica]|uniref:Formyltetrahydrofolate deformylase n=1 Tax=Promicromonospora thailandica TaxID=765201 RepID=A0A9X2JVX8_9MICO|nr:formyltetrahydrofolate deformylase [Promicromonospora thailandica]MCP2264947.1 formyltetrahydrofolate deformylase [Promicromonospora thailandica]BFF18773.1 formyltetrahydrofolate deformylase [Promicromonospora thailandica]
MNDAPRPATHWILTLSCPDQPGIVHAVAGMLAEHGGNITESQQFGDPASGLFFMRVQAESTASREELTGAMDQVAGRFGMTWTLDVVGRRIPTLIMVSKAAHCLVDLLYRERSQRMPVDVVGVVGNHRDLEDIATFYGKPFHHVPVTRDTKAEAEATLRGLVEESGAELVVLARYMQILSDELCRDLSGQIINIHHSFLPSFKGAGPYRQAHDRGVKIIGATSHYVTGDLDEGPIIEQDVERVDHSRTVEDLVGIGEDVERRTLARAVRWHAERRVLLDGRRTVVFR